METKIDIDFIVKKHHLNDTGLTRHYLTLYSIVLGMESKNVFEFGAGFSTQAMVEALKSTGGKLTSVDMRPLSVRSDIPFNFDNDNIQKTKKLFFLTNKSNSSLSTK